MSGGLSKRLEQTSAKPTVYAAIYARYSSDNQNRESANDQINRLLYYLDRGQIPLIKFSTAKYNIVIPPHLIFKDEAKTGRTASREGYEQFWSSLRSKEAQIGLVDDLSRIIRELGEQTDKYRLLKVLGTELYSLCDNVSSEGPNSKVFFQIKGLVNELSNDIHAQRTRRGQEARVLKGYSSGDICYGYYSEATQIQKIGAQEVKSHFKIHINPDEAKIVNLIFDFKLKGLGLSAIAKELNKRQIPSTTRGQKITGREVNWSPSAIRKILTREKYIGIWAWGKSTRLLHPETKKFIKQDQPKDRWLAHLEGEEIREDLAIVPIEKWKNVQHLFAETTAKFKDSREKMEVVRDSKQVGSKSGTLLAGVLMCGECGSQMLQVTGQKGGFYGCYMNHRKDKSRCNNNRLLSRKKAEAKIAELLKDVFLQPAYLESATKRANEIVRSRLRAAPEEIKVLELKRRDAEREIQNLIKFVSVHGDSSTTIKENLTTKERELTFLTERVRALKSANVDRLLLTPFALKAKFQNLLEYFQADPVIANAYLKQLFPNGLKCSANTATEKKNHNQRNSFWSITGVMLVDEYLNLPKIHHAIHLGGIESTLTAIEGQV
ncbi:MAG: recombinase family protein [Bdellovibrionales bacterium]|nr:recombinase family protein [Bdellovibrionales bacterium]